MPRIGMLNEGLTALGIHSSGHCLSHETDSWEMGSESNYIILAEAK